MLSAEAAISTAWIIKSQFMKIKALLLILAALATIAYSSIVLSQALATSIPTAEFPHPEQTPDRIAVLSSMPKISALLAESLRASGERQLTAAYLRDLRKKIQSQPDVLEQELNLNRNQLSRVHRLLVAIDNEDLRLTLSRIEAMCEVWNSAAESATDDERISEALEVYQRLESADSFKNRYRQIFFTDINKEIGADTSLAIQEHMREFAQRFHTSSYSWTDLVHTIGAELQQLKFSCEQTPASNR